MVRWQDTDEQRKREALEQLPESDKRFIDALGSICETLQPPELSYAVPSPRMQRTLRRADRRTLFGIIVECLGLLFGAPALQRIKTKTRARRNGQQRSR